MAEEHMECVPYESEGWDLENNYPRLEKSNRIAATVYTTEQGSTYGPTDCETLKELWRTLGFDEKNIRELRDPTRNQLMDWARKLAAEINVKTIKPDAFNFAFIGHGKEGDCSKEGDCACEYMILKEDLGKPNTFHVKELMDIFAAYNCPGLVTIPKFYIFQRCRGGRKEFPVQLASASGGDWVAPTSDTLCLHGSPPGYVCWYNKENGRSILVDTVSEVFLRDYKTEHLKSMIESVIKKIKGQKLPNGYCQSPHCVEDSFDKRMFFYGVGGSLRSVVGAVPIALPTGSHPYAVCSSQPNLQLHDVEAAIKQLRLTDDYDVAKISLGVLLQGVKKGKNEIGNMVNMAMIESVVHFLQKQHQRDRGDGLNQEEEEERQLLLQTAWEVLDTTLESSKQNCNKFLAADGVVVLQEHLQSFPWVNQEAATHLVKVVWRLAASYDTRMLVLLTNL